jgi:hypothetical protein
MHASVIAQAITNRPLHMRDVFLENYRLNFITNIIHPDAHWVNVMIQYREAQEYDSSIVLKKVGYEKHLQ